MASLWVVLGRVLGGLVLLARRRGCGMDRASLELLQPGRTGPALACLLAVWGGWVLVGRT